MDAVSAATVPAAETSQGNAATMAAALEGLGIFRGVEAPAQPAAPAEPVAPATATQTEAAIAAAVEVDPLVFSDERLATPEGIKAARTAIETEVKKANELRKKAHNAHAAAESREAKFKKTKEAVLADKHALATQFGILQSDIKAIQSGDPDAFLKAIGRLSGSPDPDKFWRDAALNLASGGKMREPEKAAVDPALQQRLDQLEQHVREQGRVETEAKLAALHAQQVQFAQTTDAHPLVKNYSVGNPAQIDQALTFIREQEFARTGRPIDVKVACDMLETELKAQYELLQRAAPQTGEKVAATLAVDVGRETNALAKPGMTASSSQAQPQVTTIPASLSAQPGAARRPTTEREKREAIANSLPSTFWRNLGFAE
jgi:hypothetical protein